MASFVPVCIYFLNKISASPPHRCWKEKVQHIVQVLLSVITERAIPGWKQLDSSTPLMFRRNDSKELAVSRWCLLKGRVGQHVSHKELDDTEVSASEFLWGIGFGKVRMASG